MEALENAVAACGVNVADIGFEAHARGNAVDRAGKDFADADCGYSVDGAGGFGSGLERQDQFGRGGQRVFASGHQLCAGMAAFAFDHECAGWPARRCAVTRPRSMSSCSRVGPCSMCNSTNWWKRPAGQGYRFQRAGESCLSAQFIQASAFLVAQGPGPGEAKARRPSCGCRGNRCRSGWALRR